MNMQTQYYKTKLNNKRASIVITVWLPANLNSLLKKMVEDGIFISRSEAIRTAVEHFLLEKIKEIEMVMNDE